MAGQLEGDDDPGLIVSLPRSVSSKAADGVLTIGDIAELKLDADWVILSACNTAATQSVRHIAQAVDPVAYGRATPSGFGRSHIAQRIDSACGADGTSPGFRRSQRKTSAIRPGSWTLPPPASLAPISVRSRLSAVE